MNGYFCQGFNPLLSFPNRGKITAALSKLKFLVTMDPLETETARFWENHGEYNDVDTAGDPDRGDPASDDLLCRGRRLADQLRPLAAVALGRRHASGRGQDRHLDHGADLPAAAASSTGRRAGRFPTRSSTCTGPTRIRERPAPGGDRQGAQRLRARGREGPDRPDQGAGREGQAGRRASRSCATTARPRAAAGSIPAASTRPATTWPAGTTPIPTTTGAYLELGVLLAGSTGASSTIALRRT